MYQRGFLFVQMALRAQNEQEEIKGTSLSFEFFCQIGRRIITNQVAKRLISAGFGNLLI